MHEVMVRRVTPAPHRGPTLIRTLIPTLIPVLAPHYPLLHMGTGVPRRNEAIVGRDAELTALDQALDALDAVHASQASAAPTARFLMIQGEPGIGKTMLLDALATDATSRGYLVLDGRAAELEQDVPFGVMADALDDYVATVERALDARLSPGMRDEVAFVLSQTERWTGAPAAPSGPDDRLQAYRATSALLAALAADTPLVLALDDLHWADRGSLELLGHLLRRPPRAAVLVAGAFRPRQVDAALAAEVAAAEASGTATGLRLGPLSPDAADRLVDLPAGERRRLYDESGGNPFYLQQLARYGRSEDRRADAPGAADAVPLGVRMAIDRELGNAGATARRLAEGAAVAGDPFELDLAMAAAGLDEDDALAALDELADLDLVRPTAIPRQFQFRHPLVRAAVHAATPPGTALQAHARCAELLAARGAPASARAHHVEHAARHGDRDAIALLAEAAAQVSARAPASAGRWLQHAERLLPEDASAHERLALLAPLPPLLMSVGELEGAHDALVRLLDLWPADDARTRAELTAGCSGIEGLMGRHADAAARLRRAMADLDSDEGPGAVSLLVAATIAGGYEGTQEELRTLFARTVAAGRRLDDPVLRATAVAAGTMGAATASMYDTALALRDEATDLVDDLSDDDAARGLSAFSYLAAAEVYLGLFVASAAHARRGLAVARQAGRLGGTPMLIPPLGASTWILGNIAEALELLDDAVERARCARQQQALGWILFNLSFVQQSAGVLDLAHANAVEALQVADAMDNAQVRSWAGMTLAAAELELGRPEAALEALQATSGEDAAEIRGHWRLFALEKVVRCQVALDRPEAAATAELGEALASEWGLPLAQAWGRRASARVALARGDARGAATLAFEAAELADRAAARLESAQSRALAGEALAAAGDRDAAVAPLQHAAATYAELGAARWLGEAERELGRLGHRPHRRSRPAGERGPAGGVAALTGRELEVARLVVDRRTNAEIAAHLYLSTKTVETHLRNIFAKLGVGSRTEVARAVERDDAGSG